MYILKNACLSIIRNKGRNILIGIIIVIIACACSVTLAIRSSAKNLITSYENQYDISATLEVNRDSLMKNFNPSSEDKEQGRKDMIDQFNNIESLTIENIENYSDSDYLKNYYYTNSINVNSSTINKATSEITDNEENRKRPDNMQMPDNNISQADFTLTGYSSYEAMNDFITGSYTISEGSIDNDFSSNSCVINSELATLNNINVGDTITMTNPDDESKTYQLVVSGIFTENNSDSENSMNMFSKSANTIITNANFINNIISNDNSVKYNITPTFIIKDKDSISNFESELKEKGLSEYLTLRTNLDEVEGATSSISNLSTFATTFLIVTFAIGAVILFVINMINVRERKYEIGVLRTIGMKKSALTTQFIIELLIITIIGLLIGSLIGALISVPTANMLLKNEIEASQNNMENVNKNFGGKMFDGNNQGRPDLQNRNGINGIVNVKQVDSIEAVVDFGVLLKLLGIGILLTLISSIASMISIQRFSPLTILKERS